MAKRPSKSAAISSKPKSLLPDGLVNSKPVAYPIADESITALQISEPPDRHPDGDGPWNNEADKVAWNDQETGLGCIMLRQKNGTISGYVGVPLEHPFFGFEADAVPADISNTVHGGLTYGKACEVNRFDRMAWGKPRKERYTVCHVTRVRLVQSYRTVQTTADEFHEDLWWFGFDTDHPGDFIPSKSYGCSNGDVYRDQSFVYANCIALARKLKSISPPADASPAKETAQNRLLPPPEKGGSL